MRAAKLREHSDARVAAAAKECVRVWKKLAEAAGVAKPAAAAGSSAAALSASASASSTSSSTLALPSPILLSPSSSNSTAAALGSPTASAGSASAPGTRVPAAPALPPAARLTVVRQRVKDMLKRVFVDIVTAHAKSEEAAGGAAGSPGGAGAGSFDAEAVGAACDRVAGEAEEAMFVELARGDANKPDGPYIDQYKTLAFNLKGNVPLALSIYEGVTPPSQLARMSSEELLSAEARAAIETARREALEARQEDWKQRNKTKLLQSAGLTAGEGALTCPKCRSKNTEYTQKQTRSADEPMTT